MIMLMIIMIISIWLLKENRTAEIKNVDQFRRFSASRFKKYAFQSSIRENLSGNTNVAAIRNQYYESDCTWLYIKQSIYILWISLNWKCCWAINTVLLIALLKLLSNMCLASDCTVRTMQQSVLWRMNLIALLELLSHQCRCIWWHC